MEFVVKEVQTRQTDLRYEMGNVEAPDATRAEELKQQFLHQCDRAALAITEADVSL